MRDLPASQETSAATEIVRLIERFNLAFNGHDLDATMAAMTDDCVFDNTYPAPDGTRHVGQAAVRAAFEEFFRSSPSARFDVEEMFAAGDHCVVRWVYTWDGDDPAGHVRGVDVFRVEDGKIAEKLSYVKG
jgi:ketosteroid isomerase-like protein